MDVAMMRETASTLAMLKDLRRARALLDGCQDLVFANLEFIPVDVLRKATDDIFEIRAIAGEIYDPIAFQIAHSELAELEAEESTGTTATEATSPSQGVAHGGDAAMAVGENVCSVTTLPENLPAGLAGDHDPRAHAEGLLKKAYATIMSRIRNKGREQPADTEYRDSLLADFRARVAAMSDEDRAYFGHQEASYRGRAAKLQERVNAMLKFWDLPGIADEGQLQTKDMRKV